MKKITAFASLLLVFALIFTLCSCDFKIQLGDKGKEDTTISLTLPQGGETVVFDNSDESDVEEAQNKLTKDEVKKNKEFYTVKEKTADKGVSESRVKDGEKSKENDEEIIKTKQYTIVGRMVKDGETSEYKIAQNGNKFALMTSYNGKPIGVIVNDTTIYMVDTESESYLAIPRSLLQSDGGDELEDLLGGTYDDGDHEVTEEGKKTVDGQELSYKKYDDGSISYYSGSVIVMTDDGEGTVIYYDSVSDEAPDSLFIPPKGYKRDTLSAETMKKYSSLDTEETTEKAGD